MHGGGGLSFDAAAPLTGGYLAQIAPDPRAYFDLLERAGGKPTLLGHFAGGEECGGSIFGFLCRHPDSSSRTVLADVFFSSFCPEGEGARVTNLFYTFRQLSARGDVSPNGAEGGYHLAVALSLHRPDDNGWAVNQFHRNNAIMSQAGIVQKHERGNVPYNALFAVPGSSVLYEASNLASSMCGGLPTLHFDFYTNTLVKIKDIVSKPEYNGRTARVGQLPDDPNHPEARYEVLFTEPGKGPIGFRARPRNLEVVDAEGP